MTQSHHPIVKELQALATVNPADSARFFKTAPGEYAAHDQFLGVTVPVLRQHAKRYENLALDDIAALLQSPFNEVRFYALVLITTQYEKAAPAGRQELFDFYLTHIGHVNNWNLVDASAHLIVGRHLFEGRESAALTHDHTLLRTLVASDVMWERRIGMVATWWFIRQNDVAETFKLASMLLGDGHDLMHKASGWMLREAGKRDVESLRSFLKTHAQTMPRTMLRYSIERMDATERKMWLSMPHPLSK